MTGLDIVIGTAAIVVVGAVGHRFGREVHPRLGHDVRAARLLAAALAVGAAVVVLPDLFRTLGIAASALAGMTAGIRTEIRRAEVDGA